MVRSMVAAVAGLKTHQSKMDVIGNNIANVNTWGFKSYSFNFQDSMYANSINGSGGSTMAGAAGGRNASQVGYGSTLSSITNEFGTGAPSPSSNPLDCMIDGTGFFLVGNMINGSFTTVADSGLFLSRVGIFRVDNNGYLVDDQRSYVYGYAVKQGTGIPEVSNAKSKASLQGVAITIDDATGVVSLGGIPGGVTTLKNADLKTEKNYTDALEAWKTGTSQAVQDLLNTYNIQPDGVHRDTATSTNDGINLTVECKTAGPNDATTLGAIPVLASGKAEIITQGKTWQAAVPAEYEDELSAIRIPNDEMGNQYEIQSYKINEDGTIVGVDKENRVIAIGQLALVTVENPNGLEKTSGYYYTPGANAGDVGAMKPNGGPAGKIMGGYLEMANVDLANEFSNMITTQRGFQANSKIITVTDEMLQELVNMKR